MCGICGIIRKHTITKNDENLVHKMNEVQKHRGPDDEGIFADEHVVLGHRRLSIFDLSAAGHQPMSYKDKYVISYNGEIYNYLEIKEELKKEGYRFSSHTDTEVILAAYDKWGMECLHQFNGFWAFALFDIKKQKLILSRDRFGVKPLYYCRKGDRILFSSEIKAILQDQSVKRIANEKVVLDYLVNGLVDFSDETFFKGIRKIPAGNYMIVQKDLSCQLKCFYRIGFSDNVTAKADIKNIREFRNLFANAVELRMRSDVPFGSCLSGGLDSSAIVCQISSFLKKTGKQERLQTFSACYKDFALDERGYIDEMIRAVEINPNFVYPDSEMFMEDLENVIYHQDEPFGTASICASYAVMRLAGKQGISVLLDGQGADEILCGYRKSRIYYIKKLISKRKFVSAFRELLYAVPQFRVTESKENDISKLLQIQFQKRNMKKEKAFLNQSFAKQELVYNYHSSDNFMDNDFYKISLPALLRFADRNAMAFSIEDRLPFLDVSLVEYAARLPLTAKIRNGWSKYIMRKALPMPRLIRNRKDKIGFSTPDMQWLKENERYFRGLFCKDFFKAERFIDHKKIVREWEKIMSGEIKLDLFRYVCLELWMEKFDVC